jgi:hypothetical protein
MPSNPVQKETFIASLGPFHLCRSFVLSWFSISIFIFVNAAGRDSVRHRLKNGGRETEQGYISSTMFTWLTRMRLYSDVISVHKKTFSPHHMLSEAAPTSHCLSLDCLIQVCSLCCFLIQVCSVCFLIWVVRRHYRWRWREE